MTDDDIERLVREAQGLGPMSPLEFQAETARLRAYAVRRARDLNRSGPTFEREKSLLPTNSHGGQGQPPSTLDLAEDGETEQQ